MGEIEIYKGNPALAWEVYAIIRNRKDDLRWNPVPRTRLIQWVRDSPELHGGEIIDLTYGALNKLESMRLVTPNRTRDAYYLTEPLQGFPEHR